MEIHYHVDLLTTVGISKQNQCQMVSQLSAFFCFLLMPCVIEKEKHNTETQEDKCPASQSSCFILKQKKFPLNFKALNYSLSEYLPVTVSS